MATGAGTAKDHTAGRAMTTLDEAERSAAIGQVLRPTLLPVVHHVDVPTGGGEPMGQQNHRVHARRPRLPRAPVDEDEDALAIAS